MREIKITFGQRYSSYFQPLCLLVIDFLAILLAELASIAVRNLAIDLLGLKTNSFYLSDFYFYLLIPLIFLVSLNWGRTYIRLLSIGEMVRRTSYSVVYAIIVTVVILFLAKQSPVVSRLFITLLGGFVFIFVCIGRLAMRIFFNRLGLFLEPTILVGSGYMAKKILNYTVNNSFFGIKVVGVIDDEPPIRGFNKSYPLLGTIDQAKEIIQKSGVQNILVLAPRIPSYRLHSLIDEIFPLVKNVSWVPNTEQMPVSNMELHRLYSENLVVISVDNNLSRWYNQFAKRAFDIVVSVLGTIVISPFLLIIALLIKSSSRGPILYAHKRVGKNGEYFHCYKFRSMVANADQILNRYLAKNPRARAEWKRNHKLKRDPRVTGIGRFLRKSSLDELPQLLNVMRGEMSLVGPRPIVDEEIPKYGKYFADYILVRPGMTGLWQTSGRSDTSYEKRVRLDAWYVRNWNIWLDIGLLVRTVRVLLSKQKGAY